MNSCQKEKSEMPASSVADKKTQYLQFVGKVVSRAVAESKDFRMLIHEEAGKEFDFQHDVLYEAIKDRIAEGKTVGEYLKELAMKEDAQVNFEEVVYSLHYVQFSVPIHYDSWYPVEALPVAVLPAGWDEATLQELEVYEAGGKITRLSAKEAPDYPVLVVSEAERIDKAGFLKVDARGMVIPSEERIHYTKALELANKPKVLRTKKNTHPFIVVLRDEEFARMADNIRKENIQRQLEEQKLLKAFQENQGIHLKSAMNVNVKNITLIGYSNLPRTVLLEWNNPTNLTLRFYIYATGYFNVNDKKTLINKKLIAWSDKLKESITLDYPYEYYNIWIEGLYYQGSLQAVSNTLIIRTSERGSNSLEYVNRIFISASKQVEIEGWPAGELELTADIVKAKSLQGTMDLITVGKQVSSTREWTWWPFSGAMYYPVDKDKIYTSEEYPLFLWDRTNIGVVANYSLFTNEVYNIRWREEDGTGSTLDRKLPVEATKLALTVTGVPATYSEIIVKLADGVLKIKANDEDLGFYQINWWTPQNTKYMPTAGFAVWQSFK